MKNIIVTGCNGQLGKAINKVLADSVEYKLINTDVAELDITRIDDVMTLAKSVKPYAIINCAAYTNVNGCETDKAAAFRINAIGPRNLSIAAQEVGAKMFQVSTDYVFSGDTGKHYKEYDTPHPMSAYGETKLQGELMTKEFCSRHFILRTAWLYGEGKNFVRTMLQLAEKNETVEVVADQYGTPTWSMETLCARAQSSRTYYLVVPVSCHLAQPFSGICTLQICLSPISSRFAAALSPRVCFPGSTCYQYPLTGSRLRIPRTLVSCTSETLRRRTL